MHNEKSAPDTWKIDSSLTAKCMGVGVSKKLLRVTFRQASLLRSAGLARIILAMALIDCRNFLPHATSLFNNRGKCTGEKKNNRPRTFLQKNAKQSVVACRCIRKTRVTSSTVSLLGVVTVLVLVTCRALLALSLSLVVV